MTTPFTGPRKHRLATFFTFVVLVVVGRQFTPRTSSANVDAARATPIVQFASSTSAYATRRGSFFPVRLKSPRPVVPSSPVRV